MGTGGVSDTSQAPGDPGEDYKKGICGLCINKNILSEEKEGITKSSIPIIIIISWESS